jgi:hypothetical protein
MAEALERFGKDFRFQMTEYGPVPREVRPEDREHLFHGYRKAGALD